MKRYTKDLLLLLKSLLLTPLVLWNWGVFPHLTGEYLPPGRMGPLVYGGENKPFGWACRRFNFRWHGFTYKCSWDNANWHGVHYAVRYEMNRMRQVRDFVASGGKNAPYLKLDPEEVRKANGL